jgi:biotin carboxyl carrier protein
MPVAPRRWTVKEIHIAPGQEVEAEQTLAIIE